MATIADENLIFGTVDEIDVGAQIPMPRGSRSAP
jgi:hypothetical protein